MRRGILNEPPMTRLTTENIKVQKDVAIVEVLKSYFEEVTSIISNNPKISRNVFENSAV